MAEIRKWKDGQGNYLWAAPSTSEQVGTILGKPIYTDDYMDGLGAGKCPGAVADWNRAYTIADRMGVSILRHPYTNKPFVPFQGTKRGGRGSTHCQAIKLPTCAGGSAASAAGWAVGGSFSPPLRTFT